MAAFQARARLPGRRGDVDAQRGRPLAQGAAARARRRAGGRQRRQAALLRAHPRVHLPDGPRHARPPARGARRTAPRSLDNTTPHCRAGGRAGDGPGRPAHLGLRRGARPVRFRRAARRAPPAAPAVAPAAAAAAPVRRRARAAQPRAPAAARPRPHARRRPLLRPAVPVLRRGRLGSGTPPSISKKFKLVVNSFHKSSTKPLGYCIFKYLPPYLYSWM